MSIPPAWHPDPTGRHDHRWWDGSQWTEHVADAGVASVDPLDGPAPSGDTDAAAGPGTTGGAVAGSQPTAGSDAPATGGADSVGPGETSGGPGTGWTSPQGEQTPPGAAGATAGAAGAWGAGTAPAQGGGWSGQQPAAGGGGAYDWNTGQPATPTGSDGMAVTSMILGLLAVAISWIPFLGILGALAGIVAIVLGPIAMKRIKTSGRGGRGMAITGLVTGIVSVVLAILVTVGMFTFFRSIGWGPFQEYAECMEEVGDEDFCEQQLEEELEQRFFGGA